MSDIPFELESAPNQRWNSKAVAALFDVSVDAISGLVSLGRIPPPWLKRKGRSYWAPEQVRPYLEGCRYRHGVE
jgi:hypothetical protein